MAGSVNPYYSGRRSTPMSQFVDESLPSELLLKAGTSKQTQQDQIQSLVDEAGLWDLENIGAGDQELVEEMRGKVSDFVDTNSRRNLTGAEAQRDVKGFLTKLTTDRELKQVTLNKQKVDAMKAHIIKLKAEGNQQFDPSVRKAQRELDAYRASGSRGQAFGDLNIQKALDLEAKERTYSDNLKPTAGEELTYGIRNLPSGFIGKKGWKKLLPERIVKRAEDVSKSYALTPEGRQAMALYREEVLDYNQDVDKNPDKNENDRPGVNPNDVSANDYLVQRLTEAGLEYAQDDNQIGIQRSVFPTANSKSAKPGGPDGKVIVENNGTIPLDEKITDLEGMREQVQELKKTGASIDQINAVQSKIDQSINFANGTPEGQAIIKSLTNIVTPGKSTDQDEVIVDAYGTDLGQFGVEKMNEEGMQRGYKYAHDRADMSSSSWQPKDYTDDEIKQSVNSVSSNLAPIYTAVGKYMSGKIKEEVGNMNLPFAKSLSMGFPYYADYELDNTTGEIVHGIRLNNKGVPGSVVKGEGEFVPYTDMGVTSEDQEFLKAFEHKAGDAAAIKNTGDDVVGKGYYDLAGTHRTHTPATNQIVRQNKQDRRVRDLPWVDYTGNVDAFNYGALMDKAGGIYSTDNDYQNDATDNVVKMIEDYYSLVDKGEGRQAVQSNSLLTFDKKFNDTIKQGFIQGNNLMNMNVHNPSKGGAVDELNGEKIKKIRNASPSDLTINPLSNAYGIQLTINKGTKAESFILKPKLINGRPQQNDKVDEIYNMFGAAEGNSNFASEVKSESAFRSYTTSKAQPVSTILGFNNQTFSPINGEQMTIRLNPNDLEVVGIKKGGVFTDDQVQRAQGHNPYILGIGGKDITYNQLQDKLDILKSSATSDSQKAFIRGQEEQYFLKVANEGNLNLSKEDVKNAYIAKLTQEANPNYVISDSKIQENLKNILLARTRPVTATNYNKLALYSSLMRTR